MGIKCDAPVSSWKCLTLVVKNYQKQKAKTKGREVKSCYNFVILIQVTVFLCDL